MKDTEIMISKAPEDPKKKKEWANHMLRIQVAFWVDDGRKCGYCKKKYKSVDDWLERKPRRGYGKGWAEFFIDTKCWDKYMEKKKK